MLFLARPCERCAVLNEKNKKEETRFAPKEERRRKKKKEETRFARKEERRRRKKKLASLVKKKEEARFVFYCY